MGDPDRHPLPQNWETVKSLRKLRDGMKLRIPWPEDADGQKWSTRHGVLRGDHILLDTGGSVPLPFYLKGSGLCVLVVTK